MCLNLFQVKKQTFETFNQAAVSFKFRTFLQDAVLFLVSRLDLISYIGVYVNDGKVVSEMVTSGNAKYTITSVQDYNDANWYQVNLQIYNPLEVSSTVNKFASYY